MTPLVGKEDNHAWWHPDREQQLPASHTVGVTSSRKLSYHSTSCQEGLWRMDLHRSKNQCEKKADVCWWELLRALGLFSGARNSARRQGYALFNCKIV